MGCNIYTSEGVRQPTWAVTYIPIEGGLKTRMGCNIYTTEGVRQLTWAVTYILRRGGGSSHGL